MTPEINARLREVKRSCQINTPRNDMKELTSRRLTWEAIGMVVLFFLFCLCYNCSGIIQNLKPIE